MRNQFIKVTTYYGEAVWLNVENIVSIKESDELQDTFIILTNTTDETGKGKHYEVQGSPEVFFDAFGLTVSSFS